MSLFSFFINLFKKKDSTDIDILIQKIDNALESPLEDTKAKEKKFWVNNGTIQKLVTEQEFETEYKNFFKKGRLKRKKK